MSLINYDQAKKIKPMRGDLIDEETHRIGKFEISDEMVYDNVEILSKALAEIGFVPVEVTHHWGWRTFDMVGYSHRFEKVSRNLIPPHYEFIFSKNEEGEVVLEEVRKLL